MTRFHLCCAALVLALLSGCAVPNARVATTRNHDAELSGALPLNPLGGRVITSFVNRQTGTTSTLFGNDAAARHALTGAGSGYPAGSILSLVTWEQQEDPRWFGARIPAAVVSVEIVTMSAGGAGEEPVCTYRKFAGAPLKEVSVDVGRTPHGRAAYLLLQRAAIMP